MLTQDYILTVIVTIVTVVDPLGLSPIFLSLAGRFDRQKQKKIVWKAFFVALFISTLFQFFGKYLLRYLDVSFEAVYIVGGVLLFMIGLEMIYARPRRTKTTPEEEEEALQHDDLSVFPLAVPMLSGPGTIATVVMFSSKYDTFANQFLIFSAVSVSFLLCAGSMIFAANLTRILGNTGLNVMNRIIGILLCSLAVQFCINALTRLFHS